LSGCPSWQPHPSRNRAGTCIKVDRRRFEPGIASRVEAPCRGRTIAGAAGAVSCADIALAIQDHLLRLDALRQTRELMSRELRRTTPGALSTTPASTPIEAGLCRMGPCSSWGRRIAPAGAAPT
jgi:hypothetical protein